DDEDLISKTLHECLGVMNKYYSPEAVSASVATKIHRKCYEVLEDSDPYAVTKKLINQAALKVLPAAKEKIYENSPSEGELFRRAVLASVVANYFDFGIMGFDASEDKFEAAFLKFFEQGLDVDDTPKMLGLLQDVVYIADNCGEILFDMMVFDVIKKLGGKITLVVRGAPILTDVTLEEVKEFEINKKVDRVMTTGSNAVGILIEEAPAELLEAMKDATLIISKGMANYETLSEHNFGPIAYMLLTKCECVAEDLGLEQGLSVAKLMNFP
ncbi:MAG: damage-control phosphatase, subfamily, partial [Euryarchaeota archaeon]|nr:damage-control phosphatase, subfamily [Euryarchaeota archaeon]